jgi:hypothetical protein
MSAAISPAQAAIGGTSADAVLDAAVIILHKSGSTTCRQVPNLALAGDICARFPTHGHLLWGDCPEISAIFGTCLTCAEIGHRLSALRLGVADHYAPRLDDIFGDSGEL